MWKHCTYLFMFVVMMAVALGGPAYGAFDILKDPGLVGWWTCDEGTGSTVADSSPNHRDGTAFQGSLIWGPGNYGNAIELKIPTLVQIPTLNMTMTESTMAGWIRRIGSQADWASFIMTRGSATGFNLVSNSLCYHWGDASNTWSARPTAPVPDNEWTFCAVTVDPAKALFYINGNQVYVNTVTHGAVNWNAPVFLGGDGSGSFDDRRLTDAWLDDVSLWNRALTADEIKVIMGGLATPGIAEAPAPGNEAVDVPQDASLSWTAGPFAATHDVYLGTVFADVNDAGRGSPVLVNQGQAATAYQPPALLDYGQTYYWRVDEVNAPPDGTIFKGDVWSFTVEPYGYPVTPVSATASSFQTGMGPANTINGSGLTGDLHGVEPTTMWLSAGAQPNWIQYEFDQVYRLYEMKVWNSNQLIESFLGFGAKNVTIETSTDGTTWTALADVPEFSRAPAAAGYAANTTVNFGGAEAKFVKLTINSNWGGVAPQAGLAEVQFSYIPVQARQPQPAADATGVELDASLNWRPGRGATSHAVSFGTDEDAVAHGTAPVETVTGHSYDPASLLYGTTYYWKVDEVGEATYPGDLWSFTTREFSATEDFESYTDQAGEEIFTTWIDGFTTGLNGSTVGYLIAANGTYGETTIVHSGKQSMPLQYDNSKAPFFSEAEREFSPAQNWTLNGATDVGLWFRGNPVSFLDKGNNAFAISGGGNDIWNNADAFRFAYKQLNGNGSITAKVESIGNTNGWAKTGVMIRESLAAGSTHAMVVVTPANSCSFQYRQSVDGASGSANWSGTAVTAPYWVRLTRTGNLFKAETSPDGKTWTQLGTDVTILMGSNVLIGLPVTSHDVALTTTAELSNVSTTGNVTGAWQAAAVGSDPQPGNSPEALYVIVEDSAGKSKVVMHPDPAASAVATWQLWTIPLSDFTSAGVKMTAVKSLTIGVGNKAAPTAGATGTVYIDDIGYGKPAAALP
jgi:hypothetical protein